MRTLIDSFDSLHINADLILNRMVNLKTCIVDTQESLVNLVRICDAMVEVDEYSKSVSAVSLTQYYLFQANVTVVA